MTELATEAPAVTFQPFVPSVLVPLARIDRSPRNPRTHVDPVKLEELAKSIGEVGVIEPIIVRVLGDRYELIAGERRCRAAHMAGLVDIPTIVREIDDKEAAWLQTTENEQREDLHPLELQMRYLTLIRQFPQSGRAKFAITAKESGREAAITEMLATLAASGVTTERT